MPHTQFHVLDVVKIHEYVLMLAITGISSHFEGGIGGTPVGYLIVEQFHKMNECIQIVLHDIDRVISWAELQMAAWMMISELMATGT